MLEKLSIFVSCFKSPGILRFEQKKTVKKGSLFVAWRGKGGMGGKIIRGSKKCGNGMGEVMRV